MKTAALLLVLGATACRTLPSSSVAVLGPERSAAVMRRSPDHAALEVVRLFAQRGFAVVDAAPLPGGGTVVRMMGRRLVHVADHVRDLGSAFEATITPHGEHAEIALAGRATYEGSELCTEDKAIRGPCRKIYYLPDDQVDGRTEAQVIHGVLSELRLLGAVDDTAVPASVSIARRESSRDECLAHRKRQLELAQAIEDPDARARATAGVEKAAPRCD